MCLNAKASDKSKAKVISLTSLFPYFPTLTVGLLTGKFHKNPDVLKDMPFLRRMLTRGKIGKTCPLVNILEDIAVVHN
jgi:hypothetical protein